MTYSKQCLEKQRRINELQEQLLQLKAKLRYQERTAREGLFGSSTPSSKLPIKPNSPKKDHPLDRGGGKVGHKGHGRSGVCEKAERLYHWAGDRNIPADNNLAERELRPLVIARKISFGSQSDAGARTREVLMTVLHTLRKRGSPVMEAFKSALDKLAQQPDLDPSKVLFNLDSS